MVEVVDGLHILRRLSQSEMLQVEELAASGKFAEAAERFCGRVTYGGPVVNAMKLEAAIREAIRIGSQPHYGDEVAALFHYSEAMDVLREALNG
jgi:hypothetical protein